MTALVHRHPEQYLHRSRFTRYLQYFRDGGPSYMMMVDDGDDDDDDDDDGDDDDDDDDEGS